MDKVENGWISVHTIQYYLALRKSFPFVMLCNDFEGILLNEVIQTKTNNVCSH